MMSRPCVGPACLAIAAAGLFLSACSEKSVFAPEPEAPPPVETVESHTLARLHCSVSVGQQSMSCAAAPISSGLSANSGTIVIGGQEMYVKLASSGTAYDGGAQQLSSQVTLQNLIQQAIGTLDGVTVHGVRVFFAAGPTVTGGFGTVTVGNPDGIDTFLGPDQPYFLYNSILTSYEVSQPRTWVFAVPATVETFTFSVYVSAPVSNEALPLLDALWTGAESTDWHSAANWKSGVVPACALIGMTYTCTGVVSILPAAVEPVANMPVLAADAGVFHLRVGAGSTLTMNGHTVEVAGNVDIDGTVSGGVVRMSGAKTLLRGSVPSLRVTGNTTLQGATATSGAVSIADGSLTIRNQPMSISIP
jgi:hypothetical protein